MDSLARKNISPEEADPEIEITQEFFPKQQDSLEHDSQEGPNIPEAASSHVRLQTHNLIQEVIGWYEKHGTRVSVLIDSEQSLKFKKRIFNILKNNFLKPAFEASLNSQNHDEYCEQLKSIMMECLSYFIQDPDYNQTLPLVKRARIYYKTQQTDWKNPIKVKKLMLFIRRELLLPPKHSSDSPTRQ